jgi:hypothetical protein
VDVAITGGSRADFARNRVQSVWAASPLEAGSLSRGFGQASLNARIPGRIHSFESGVWAQKSAVTEIQLRVEANSVLELGSLRANENWLLAKFNLRASNSYTWRASAVGSVRLHVPGDEPETVLPAVQIPDASYTWTGDGRVQFSVSEPPATDPR